MRRLLKAIFSENGFFARQKGSFSAENQNLFSGKIAVYGSLSSSPEITELKADDAGKLAELLTNRAHQFSREKGGTIPLALIKEIIENLVHASFQEAVVSVLNNGNTIRVADHGPGIKDKRRALEPGFSTATQEMKRVIRGVGSGLAMAKEALASAGGNISIENNLGKGAVVTLNYPSAGRISPGEEAKEMPPIRLSKRQKRALSLVMEMGTVGPAGLARELEISLSSAYRDLIFLENEGLVRSNGRGKRTLTPEGIKYLDLILTS